MQPQGQVVYTADGVAFTLRIDPERGLSIGRATGNDLKVLGVGLSRRHAEIRASGDGYELTDLGSQNGCFANGQRVAKGSGHRLRPDDALRLGSLLLRFEVVDQENVQENAGDEPDEADALDPIPEEVRDSVGLLLETIADLHQHQDPRTLLPAIVDRVIRLTGAERGLLLMRGPDQLETWIARTRQGEDIERVEGTSRSIPEQVLGSGKSVCIGGRASETERGSVSSSMNDYDLNTVLCVPIREHGEVRGVLYVDSKETMRAGDRELLEALAAQCGVALERAALRKQEVGERLRLEQENASLKGGGVERPVAESEAMRDLLRSVERVAGSDLTLLVTGETGVGKEVVARYAHASSHRRGKPFVVVDCGAIPDSLLESALFGHVKGAFTGATSHQRGLFHQADGGTLLLDEIGELPLALQPKLLRFLEEQTFLPVGEETRQSVDVRVIACTNRDLEDAIQRGTFREDLFFRLNTYQVRIPALRERREDVVPLARHLLVNARRDSNAPDLGGFTREALDALRAYDWPGNVRELAHRMRRASVMATPPFVTVDDLDLPGGDLPLLALQEARKRARKVAMDGFEIEYVTRLLRRHEGHVQNAAEAAGVSRQMLQRLMSRHGISRRAFLPAD